MNKSPMAPSLIGIHLQPSMDSCKMKWVISDDLALLGRSPKPVIMTKIATSIVAHVSPFDTLWRNKIQDIFLTQNKWFYGSSLNLSITESSVLKPAPGRTALNTAPLATPTSSFEHPLCKRENAWRNVFHLASFLVPSSHETLVKDDRWFWGGLS